MGKSTIPRDRFTPPHEYIRARLADIHKKEELQDLQYVKLMRTYLNTLNTSRRNTLALRIYQAVEKIILK
jgi:hypothetical protein